MLHLENAKVMYLLMLFTLFALQTLLPGRKGGGGGLIFAVQFLGFNFCLRNSCPVIAYISANYGNDFLIANLPNFEFLLTRFFLPKKIPKMCDHISVTLFKIEPQ